MLNKFTEERQNKFIKNSIIFLAPVALIYLMQIQATMSVAGYAFTWEDLKPTQVTFGAMWLYAINVLVDFIKKLK